MKGTLPTITFALGILFGSIMLSTVCWVYLTRQEFGIAGAFLTVFGVVLLGLSIWKTIHVSVDSQGKVSAKLEERVEQIQEDVRQVSQDAQDVKQDVQQVSQDVKELETIVVSELSPLSATQPKTVKKLRQETKSQALIMEGRYQEALEVDPDNIIALTRYIEAMVKKKNYAQATGLFDKLVKINDSGVGFGTYPALILAFEKQGDTSQALKLVSELDRQFTADFTRGVGYFTLMIDELERDLKKTYSSTTNNQVRAALASLLKKVEATLDDLEQ
jgi:tetratricopeptide (TPR) repeat protein